jgi:hypothetical protein
VNDRSGTRAVPLSFRTKLSQPDAVIPGSTRGCLMGYRSETSIDTPGRRADSARGDPASGKRVRWEWKLDRLVGLAT